MIAPTALYVVGVAVFTIDNDLFCTAVTVSVSVGEVAPPPEAEAMFVTEPLSRSACVIVYDAVQVIDAPGARLAVAGQLASVALWGTLNAADAAMVGSGPANFVPSLVLVRTGVCLLILAAVTQISRRITRLPHVVNALAQETLIVYFVHICIVYGSIWNPGLRYFFGTTLTPLPLVAIIVALIVAMAMLAAFWNRWKHMHPRLVRTVVLATGILMLLRVW